MGERGEIYSDKLFTNSERTYFFNVKENRKGDYFLNIVESKRNASGDFERHSVFIYEENIKEFEASLLRAISVIKKKISGNYVAGDAQRDDFDAHNEGFRSDDFDKDYHFSRRSRNRDY
ncbi:MULTISPECIES: DUF3276 family protein [unclassified Borrelia]|uniref:DUF3276 family protein n=1 Tax=unclassified Borrelia TaxID=2649934 RepID=UPI001E3A3F00|nr:MULTISPECIES: DUF3276 family protein [unclassified Borrelia]UGQ15766.1 PUR family DNA/RNA-binding protein [Borrelia sp. RT5S]UGQ16875.1 DUF3276 family protein [Borrelia sp. RT1S]